MGCTPLRLGEGDVTGPGAIWMESTPTAKATPLRLGGGYVTQVTVPGAAWPESLSRAKMTSLRLGWGGRDWAERYLDGIVVDG